MNNNLKSVSSSDDELRVSNYIVLFGGRDMSGETFLKTTNFDSPYTASKMLHVDFEHGLDPDGLGVNSDDVLGFVDWKTAVVDDNGIFVERVLNRHAKYMEFIEPLIDAGVIGNSSEAIGSRTRRDGKNIIDWPLKRDTLTVMPCEPRMMGENVMAAIKSLGLADIKESKTCIKSVKHLKDVEKFLREKGLSQSEATATVAAVKSIHGERDEKEEKETLNALLNFKL